LPTPARSPCCVHLSKASCPAALFELLLSSCSCRAAGGARTPWLKGHMHEQSCCDCTADASRDRDRVAHCDPALQRGKEKHQKVAQAHVRSQLCCWSYDSMFWLSLKLNHDQSAANRPIHFSILCSPIRLSHMLTYATNVLFHVQESMCRSYTVVIHCHSSADLHK
jgi:hypothetical protein